MRLLLSIGCNSYAHLGNLGGAEADATRMYETLIRPEVGGYDPTRSRLLLSPSVAEVRSALAEILFAGGQIDTFTFFFAGHGGVRAGSFYMCVQDSRLDALSVSAQSLSDIFRSISEAAPAQSNLIIDACQSGGLIADLGVLLKHDILGDAGTPGVTLVATSAQDQGSGETPAGGIGTNAILDCIEGRDFVQDSTATLDLVEIGRRISTRLQGSKQSPVVWGLNLSGPPRFCRNPSFQSDPARPVRELVQAWPQASQEAVAPHFEKLWLAYTSVSGDWDPRSFSDSVAESIGPLADTPDALGNVIDRMAAAMQVRAEQSNDPFRSAQVCAALLVCLLPHLKHAAVQQTAQRVVNATSAALHSASRQLLADVQADQYALLDSRSGLLSDLYFLPMRIAKVLGWAAGSAYLCDASEIDSSGADQVFVELLRSILVLYQGSVQTISDAQAPYWAVALSRAIALGLRDEAEQLTGLLFNSLVTCGGRLARADIPGHETLPYLIARRTGNYDSVRDYLGRPIETLTVLLKSGIALDLVDVLDPSLWKLDGTSFVAYLPADFSDFGAPTMDRGQNLVWTVGQDVYRIGDLIRTWPPEMHRPGSGVEAAAATLASLLFPDRVAWFHFDNLLISPAASASEAADSAFTKMPAC